MQLCSRGALRLAEKRVLGPFQDEMAALPLRIGGACASLGDGTCSPLRSWPVP